MTGKCSCSDHQFRNKSSNKIPPVVFFYSSSWHIWYKLRSVEEICREKKGLILCALRENSAFFLRKCFILLKLTCIFFFSCCFSQPFLFISWFCFRYIHFIHVWREIILINYLLVIFFLIYYKIILLLFHSFDVYIIQLLKFLFVCFIVLNTIWNPLETDQWISQHAGSGLLLLMNILCKKKIRCQFWKQKH